MADTQTESVNQASTTPAKRNTLSMAGVGLFFGGNRRGINGFLFVVNGALGGFLVVVDGGFFFVAADEDEGGEHYGYEEFHDFGVVV